MSARNRRILTFVGVMLVAAIAVQFLRFIVPGLKLDNPPVTRVIVWDSPTTQDLWNAACADCHSNNTDYKWYSYIAPVGWLIARDVQVGRDELNISEQGSEIELEEMIEVIREGEMPPAPYLIMHGDADLSDQAKETLINGLRATFGGISSADGEDEGEEDDND